MNTCDTCKHWKIWGTNPDPVGTCDLLGYDSKELKGADIDVYTDSVPISTGAKFGCIHHEPK